MIVDFYAFIIAITLLTVTPGLDTALVIRNTQRGGFLDGSITSIGICSGLFVHAMLSALGIAAILATSAQAFMLVKSAGALYLIYLGVVSLKKFRHASFAIGSESKLETKMTRSLTEGFVSNILNPKTAVFYMAFLPQFINPEQSALQQSMLMALIHFVIAMIWQCGLALLLQQFKQILNKPRFTQGLEGVTGAVMVMLGVKLLIEQPVKL